MEHNGKDKDNLFYFVISIVKWHVTYFSFNWKTTVLFTVHYFAKLFWAASTHNDLKKTAAA